MADCHDNLINSVKNQELIFIVILIHVHWIFDDICWEIWINNARPTYSCTYLLIKLMFEFTVNLGYRGDYTEIP